MSSHKDLVLKQLSFDGDACMELIRRIIDVHLDELSYYVKAIVIREVYNNGNGSKGMRIDACAQVKETKREIMDDHIRLEVGIDLEKLRSQEDLFVRVSVVLHGNLASGPLLTKPGQDTWKKYVTHKGLSTAKTVWMLPGEGKPGHQGFVQIDVVGDIINGVSENAEKELKHYVGAFATVIGHDIQKMNWSAFLNVR